MSRIQDGVQWGINSTGKFAAFASAHENSRNVMIKDNGRDQYYVPNPTVSISRPSMNQGSSTVPSWCHLRTVPGRLDILNSILIE
jgi:hypothetical protein